MTTTTTNIPVGSTVTFDRGKTGTVTFVGVCGHGGCKWGEECVTIRPEAGSTTVNRQAGSVEVVVA